MDRNCFNDESLIKDLVKEMGYSLVSAKIFRDGMKVGYMYREKPEEDEDSGWHFLSGTEDDDYVDDPDNSKYFGVNTVANFDPAIIPYLKNKTGTELERVEGGDKFRVI
ncbi:MAG: DUF2185 domain-containing protein [Bacteroidales bacterium]